MLGILEAAGVQDAFCSRACLKESSHQWADVINVLSADLLTIERFRGHDQAT